MPITRDELAALTHAVETAYDEDRKIGGLSWRRVYELCDFSIEKMTALLCDAKLAQVVRRDLELTLGFQSILLVHILRALREDLLEQAEEPDHLGNKDARKYWAKPKVDQRTG